jgi:hypothetical protein
MPRRRAPEHTVLLKSKKEGYSIDAWCTEKFGKRWSALDNRDGRWCCYWAGRENPGYYRWYFRDEKDLVLFLLRWA